MITAPGARRSVLSVIVFRGEPGTTVCVFKSGSVLVCLAEEEIVAPKPSERVTRVALITI